MATFTLSGIVVPINGSERKVYDWPVLTLGVDPDGNFVPMQVGSGGAIVIEPGAGQSQGGLFELPADNANGTELSDRPSATSGVRLAIPASGTVQWFIAPSGTVTTGAPTNSITYAPTTAQEFDIPLSGSDSLFIVASSGSPAPLARWVQR